MFPTEEPTCAGEQPFSPGHPTRGFGFIDVRRPHLKLTNRTRTPGDRFIVERVGYEDSLTWSVAADSMFALDWLEPGWGAMYRIIPVESGVSRAGTAFNNAVHSENPSTSTTAKDRLVVFERDSIVYLRALDSTGHWSREFRVSDAADEVDLIPAAECIAWRADLEPADTGRKRCVRGPWK